MTYFKMCQIFLFQLSPNNKTVFASKYEFLSIKFIETDEIKNLPHPTPMLHNDNTGHSILTSTLVLNPLI